MNFSHFFSFQRLWAVITKEFIQIKRDRVTFAIIIGIPLMQLILFGYAINSNPKHLPTIAIDADNSHFSRAFLQGLKNTTYFDFDSRHYTEAEADHEMQISDTMFIVNIPSYFSHDLVRGLRPSILLTADATEAMAAANSIAAANMLANQIFNRDFTGELAALKSTPSAFQLRIHARYNPELISQFNIVPALLGVVLTMTMVVITALAITRERERGTMEFLLATPVKPLEVILGKVVPYIIVGYIQVILILILAIFLFHIPTQGSLWLLFFSALPFIFANLAVGIMFSTLASNQLQATQSSFFYFLPSILLSGFMFPFFGMPKWAQVVGHILPLTYFLRITRGILLKGNTLTTTWPNIWPIIIFMVVVLMIGVFYYHRTLD